MCFFTGGHFIPGLKSINFGMRLHRFESQLYGAVITDMFLNLCTSTPQLHPPETASPSPALPCPPKHHAAFRCTDTAIRLFAKVNVPSRSMTQSPREARQLRGFVGCFFVPVHRWILALMCALLLRQ